MDNLNHIWWLKAIGVSCFFVLFGVFCKFKDRSLTKRSHTSTHDTIRPIIDVVSKRSTNGSTSIRQITWNDKKDKPFHFSSSSFSSRTKRFPLYFGLSFFLWCGEVEVIMKRTMWDHKNGFFLVRNPHQHFSKRYYIIYLLWICIKMESIKKHKYKRSKNYVSWCGRCIFILVSS